MDIQYEIKMRRNPEKNTAYTHRKAAKQQT
jgi:hypothetical protein